MSCDEWGPIFVSSDDTAIVRGVEQLSGAPVEATDLRAGAALVVAALGAVG
jgi:UDP-N-acetylglucosamine 1-carboxyvinyltransferase